MSEGNTDEEKNYINIFSYYNDRIDGADDIVRSRKRGHE